MQKMVSVKFIRLHIFISDRELSTCIVNVSDNKYVVLFLKF